MSAIWLGWGRASLKSGQAGAENSAVRFALSLVLAAVLAGCVTIHQPAGGDPSLAEAPALPAPRTDGAPGTTRSLPPPMPITQDAAAVERLMRLRDERLRAGSATDTPIGPGDVIEVSAPQLKELAFVTTRVSGDGIIVLPLVGTIRAAGRTEDDVRREIRERMGAVMYDPQVSVFVKEYRSRKVAVIGAVHKAGLYEPASPTETIFDMIAMARGPSNEAARQVVFIPQGAETDADLGSLEGLPRGEAETAVAGLLRNVEPIVFNMRDMSAAMTEVVLSLPVRPGDVIMIPDAGTAFIQGWVHKSGPYRINQDLTMLALVAAAGGPMFPADMGAARLIRPNPNGEKQLFDVDLQAIARGELADVYVQNGDVIEVGATGPRLAAYAVYYFFATVFRIGAAVTVF